jgi:hypothetical protein
MIFTNGPISTHATLFQGSAGLPGLKLGGAGEWLIEKHGTSRRRFWL